MHRSVLSCSPRILGILTYFKFIDLCILLGCDYVDPVPKIGPSTALNLIREHKTLEQVVEWVQNDPKGKKYAIPDYWPYEDARALFFEPDVRAPDHPECDFKWDAPDVEGLVKFLVTEKGFSEDRVRSAAQRLTRHLKSAQQGRLDGFFKPVQKSEEEVQSLKRKNEEKRDEKKKKARIEAKEKKAAKAKAKTNE